MLYSLQLLTFVNFSTSKYNVDRHFATQNF